MHNIPKSATVGDPSKSEHRKRSVLLCLLCLLFELEGWQHVPRRELEPVTTATSRKSDSGKCGYGTRFGIELYHIDNEFI